VQQQIISQTFNNSSLYNASSFYFQNVYAANGKYFFTGFGANKNKITLPQLTLLKTDKTGNPLLFKFFGDTLEGAFYSSNNGIIPYKNNILIGGKYANDTIFNTPLLIELDTNFKLIKIKILALGNYYSNNNYGIIKLNKNKFLLYSGGYFQQTDQVDVSLHLLDSNLNEIWIKKYGAANKWEQPYSATQLSNGNIVIGAHRYDANKVNGTRFKEQTWIFEIDTAGNMVRQFLDPDTRTGPAKGITQTADGGFVYCGKYQSNWNGKISYKWQGSIAKLKPDFSGKEWEIKIPDTLSSLVSMEDIEFLNENEFVAVGSNVTYSYNYPNDSAISGVVISFNRNGEIKWQNNYLGLDSNDQTYLNFLYDLKITPNKEILACGKSYGSQTPNYGWILSLDSTGCLHETNCGAASLSIESEQKINIQKLNIYPNPFNTIINFEPEEEIDEIALINILGKQVLVQKQPIETVNLGHLPNGFYLLKVTTTKGEITTQKIIKQ
jgi:hypothetical protein